MKVSFLLSTLFVFAVSTLLAQPVKLATIQGKMAPADNPTYITLDSLNAQPNSHLSRVLIGKDGTFGMEAAILKTDIYRLRIDDNNFLMLILSPGEQVNLKAPSTKLGVDVQVTGSAQTEFLLSTLYAIRPFEMKRDSLNRQYNAAMSSPDANSQAELIRTEFARNDSLEKVTLYNRFNQNPNSLAWIFLQDKFDMNEDFGLIDRLEKALYANYSYNLYIQQFHQQIEVERKTAVGSPAPDIALPDPEGTIRQLSALKGKVVLIDFWASWCGPCRKENPNVVAAYAKYKDKGFEVFSVSLDKDRESWLKAIAADKLVWPNHVSDLKYWKSEGAAAYGVTSIPFTVLVGRDGRIVAKKLRGEALEQKLETLLD